MLALHGFVDVLIVDPAPAMTSNLVSQLHECGSELGMPFQRHRDAEDRQRQLPALELAQDSPGPNAGAVLVDRFHAQVARLKRLRADDL